MLYDAEEALDTGREESEKLYRLSIACRKTMKTDLRALLINTNTCKTLYLNHLGSGAFIGDKVEVVAEYCSVGSPKIMPWKGLCARLLKLPDVASAGWEVL